MNGHPRCDSSDGVCHVCADDAVPARVLDIEAATRTATVSLAGSTATVALDLVDARVGDIVLVHLGFAIERLAETP